MKCTEQELQDAFTEERHTREYIMHFIKNHGIYESDGSATEKTIPVELTVKQLIRIKEVFGQMTSDADIFCIAKNTIKKLNEPEIGEYYVFWNIDKKKYSVGPLVEIVELGNHKFYGDGNLFYGHCDPIKQDALF
jgi:hypothetical protein